MRAAVLSVAVLLIVPAAVAAQVPSPVLVAPSGGARDVTGSCTTGATVRVTVKTGSTTVTLADAACAGGTFAADASTVVLRVGSEITATQTVAGQTSAAATATVAVAGPHGDQREDFEASAYLGLAIDSFSSQEIIKYLNPEENGVNHERSIFGFNFEYRLAASADRDKARQLWIYGETLHGVRSEDLDCNDAPNVPSCVDALYKFGLNIPQNALFMLRNATSLEGFVGGRYEFLNLNLPGRNPARVYVKGQLGFIDLAGSDGDAKEMHHVAIGATAVGGPRAGSYLEFGFGRNDVFILNRYRRYKIDAHLQQALGGGVNLFAQLFTDVDFKSGSDAIQSYFGLSFDVGQIVGTIQNIAR